MAVLASEEVVRYWNAMLRNVTYPVVAVADLRLCLTTGTGTGSYGDAATATEVANSGGSTYTAAVVSFAAASGRTIANDQVETFTNMPTLTVSGVDIRAVAPSPVQRKAYGRLTTDRATVLGDTLSFAVGSVVLGMA